MEPDVSKASGSFHLDYFIDNNKDYKNLSNVTKFFMRGKNEKV